jgi:ATP-dependent Clp protease, protease subunit
MTQPAWAFAVRGEGTDTLEIEVYDVIGKSLFGGGVSAREIRDRLQANKVVQEIALRINSRGGDVFDGFAIYNTLKEHPARVVADVDGLAASMASVILMAAEEIRMAPNAMLMVHEPWGVMSGTASKMRARAEVLENLGDQIVGAYADRTGQSRERVTQMMAAETWLSASDAKDLGFADVVKSHEQSDAAALACLQLDGLRVPHGFSVAVAQARAASDRVATGGAPATETTAAGGGEERKQMDLKTLKAQHPDVYEAAVQEGVKQERDRVSAHLAMSEASGDVKTAHEAIMGGDAITETVRAKHFAAEIKSRDIKARGLDEAAAAAALNGAAAPEANGSDDGDWIMVKGGAL